MYGVMCRSVCKRDGQTGRWMDRQRLLNPNEFPLFLDSVQVLLPSISFRLAHTVQVMADCGMWINQMPGLWYVD